MPSTEITQRAGEHHGAAADVSIARSTAARGRAPSCRRWR